MGEWNAAGDTEPLRVQEFSVAKIFINSNFNAANLRSDVAILRLSVPVPLGTSPAITTGCLPVNSFVGQRLLFKFYFVCHKIVSILHRFSDAGSVAGAKMTLLLVFIRLYKSMWMCQSFHLPNAKQHSRPPGSAFNSNTTRTASSAPAVN